MQTYHNKTNCVFSKYVFNFSTEQVIIYQSLASTAEWYIFIYERLIAVIHIHV